MKYLAYVLLFFFVVFFGSIILVSVFFDNDIKYLKYDEDELSDMFKKALEEKKTKKANYIYNQMDMRDCLKEEDSNLMEMYNRKYNL